MKKKAEKAPTPHRKRREWDNRRAGFEVAVEKKMEAGLILRSDEIKSIRAERVQLGGSFIKFLGGGRGKDGRLSLGQPVVVGMHMADAEKPDRSRPLLLHAKEIVELAAAIQSKGKTAVPLRLYMKNGWAKLEIGIGSGRKVHQKRALLRERDLERESRGELKRLNRRG
jgi:SsrA-binding protein